jgi:general secretion pathway protein F
MSTTNFTRTLGTLLTNGVPILTALGIVKGTHKHRSQISIKPTSSFVAIPPCLRRFELKQVIPYRHSQTSLNMLRAGEAGGSVDIVLGQLSEYIEKSKELKDTVSTAMIYPIILVVININKTHQ